MHFNHQAQKIIEHYLNSDSIDLKPQLSPEELSRMINLELNDTPGDQEGIENFIHHYLNLSVNTNNKKFANQLWSKTEPFSILGELLCAVTNTSMYTYEVAPVATMLEKKMISYLSQLIWNKSTDGIMTSGGSASNLQALMIARNIKVTGSKNRGLCGSNKVPVILAAKNAHYSIKRAVNILGIGQDHLIEVNVDHHGAIDPDDLKFQLSLIREKDQYPFCLVSTAGTTVEGSFDSLPEITKICQENNIWLHVDGAYGGSVLLSQKHKKLLEGVEHADSFSWDFHKMLGINLPCAFLFTKEKGLLQETLTSGNDSYLFHDQDQSIDQGPKSLQCGRRNDILKLWLTWQSIGKIGLEERVDKLFTLAQNFSEMVGKTKELVLIKKPQSINICFRLNGKIRHEERIRNKLLKDGDLMLNYSKNSDGPFFRLAITRPDLNESDFMHLIDRIIKVGREFN
jgi:glutamate/tyrosine decarboxylase-like PLP-dependent enzyme